MKDTKGRTIFVPCISYHLPTTDICLFSPQAHHQIWKPSESHLTDDGSLLRFVDRGTTIEIPIDRAAGNLPLLYNCSTTAGEKRRHGPSVLESLPRCPHHHFFVDDVDPEGAYEFLRLGKFGSSTTDASARPPQGSTQVLPKFRRPKSQPIPPLHPKFERKAPPLDISKATFSVTDSDDPLSDANNIAKQFSEMLAHRGLSAQQVSKENANLTAGQKELLLWQMRLGIGMHRIQRLMYDRKMKEPDGTIHELPPVIPSHHGAKTCDVPTSSCTQMSFGKRKSTGARTSRVRPPPHPDENATILQRTDLSIGDVVSCDQYVCSQSGRHETGYGREGDKQSYSGGTLYVESVSGYIWNFNQVSLGTAETLLGKEELENQIFSMSGRAPSVTSTPTMGQPLRRRSGELTVLPNFKHYLSAERMLSTWMARRSGASVLL